MSEVTMPRLSDTMQEGTIAHWLRKAGDEVKKGDILAEIETDKATMDLEAYEAGTLQQILVKEGETVPIGQAVALIGTGAVAQDVGARQAPAQQPAPAAAKTGADGAGAVPAESPPREERSTQSPVTSESGEGGAVKPSPPAPRTPPGRTSDPSRGRGGGPGSY